MSKWFTLGQWSFTYYTCLDEITAMQSWDGGLYIIPIYLYGSEKLHIFVMGRRGRE